MHLNRSISTSAHPGLVFKKRETGFVSGKRVAGQEQPGPQPWWSLVAAALPSGWSASDFCITGEGTAFAFVVRLEEPGLEGRQ